jgi:hypothetical protein
MFTALCVIIHSLPGITGFSCGGLFKMHPEGMRKNQRKKRRRSSWEFYREGAKCATALDCALRPSRLRGKSSPSLNLDNSTLVIQHSCLVSIQRASVDAAPSPVDFFFTITQSPGRSIILTSCPRISSHRRHLRVSPSPCPGVLYSSRPYNLSPRGTSQRSAALKRAWARRAITAAGMAPCRIRLRSARRTPVRIGWP